MECLYEPELTSETTSLTIRGEEFRHLWALRLRAGERILFTNGTGLCAKAILTHISKQDATLRIEELLPNYGEDTRRVGLAIGILESRERMEFALEKATELGITDFYPIACEFSQKKTLALERLQAKAIAAVKQCKRSRVTVIHPPMKVEDVLNNSSNWSKIILADMEGIESKSDTQGASTLVFIGTEGGFSPKELVALRSDSRTVRLYLGERRLRAETAAIAALCRV